MGKSKNKEKEGQSISQEDVSVTEQDNSVVEGKSEYSEKIKYVNVIAKPLAGKKLTKRLYKTIKKASKVKTLRRGVKEVVKAIRKSEKGIVVIAGDISPIDVISHVPVLCEDKNLQYVYVPSKLDLGTASLTKRPTSIVMIKQHSDITENYDSCLTEVKSLLEEELRQHRYQ